MSNLTTAPAVSVRTGFPIGAASVFAAFCMVALGVSLFASNGAANLFEVATYAVK